MFNKACIVFAIAALAGSFGFCKDNEKSAVSKNTAPEVTFVELGSVNCIPCKAMQPVMKEIEKEYGGQVKVVFYDVWTEDGRPYAEKYKIQAIPTQIFLDSAGNEFFRHMGFYPKEEIANILEKQGVKKLSGASKNSSKENTADTKMKSGQVCN